MNRTGSAALACIALLLAPSGAARAADKPRTHVVLIVADDLRADTISAYGGPVKTPNLDKLAARGALFRRATCGYPICHVSRTELLTGRCLVAEAASGAVVPFAKGWAVWPEVMRDAGWHTVYSGKWHVHGTPRARGYAETAGLYSSGGAQGQPLTLPRSATDRAVTGYTGWTFKSNDNEPLIALGIGLTSETDAHIADGAIAAVGKLKANQSLFLHVNFTAPHDPLHWPKGLENRFQAKDVKLPANFRGEHPFDHGNAKGRDETIVPAPRTEADVRRERAVYYALVENLDAQVGRVVKALEDRGELGRTVVVFTSDHGLSLGCHGLMGKQNQYEHTANVPLILAGPGVPAGKTFDAQCALRDLFPTACELTGARVPEGVPGKSLVPVLGGQKAEVHDAIYGYFTDTQRMIRTPDGWKLIWYPKADRVQLFHVAKDADELNDLAAAPAQRERRKDMTAALKSWLRDRGDALGKE
jgi:arylsulfatase A-like enzyme